ncbi:MAG TPA: hypothetical protein VGR26_10345 [Acidimicrobiales bacterium]|nr:hypothetical protein [Acidimicrobiales bacterium]
MATSRRGEAWRRTVTPGEWEAQSDAGDKRALVKTVAGDYHVTVYRHPTGPTPGPDPEPAHGPQIFSQPEEALEYAETRLGW